MRPPRSERKNAGVAGRVEQAEKLFLLAVVYAIHVAQGSAPGEIATIASITGGEVFAAGEFDRVAQSFLDRSVQALGDRHADRRGQALAWMWSRIEDGLKDRFFENTAVNERLRGIQGAVERGDLSPTLGADKLLSLLDSGS